MPKSSIDREIPLRCERLEDAKCMVGIGHDRALGQLELQTFRRDTGLFEQLRDDPGEARFEEAARRDVDGYSHHKAVVGPAAVLLERGAHDDPGQRPDDAGPLRQWHKSARRRYPMVRVLPSHQGLHPGNAARCRVRLGLVVEDDLRLADGEDVDASEYVFRATTHIETAATDFDWLNKGVFISVGGRQPGGVIYEVYLVE